MLNLHYEQVVIYSLVGLSILGALLPALLSRVNLTRCQGMSADPTFLSLHFHNKSCEFLIKAHRVLLANITVDFDQTVESPPLEKIVIMTGFF